MRIKASRPTRRNDPTRATYSVLFEGAKGSAIGIRRAANADGVCMLSHTHMLRRPRNGTGILAGSRGILPRHRGLLRFGMAIWNSIIRPGLVQIIMTYAQGTIREAPAPSAAGMAPMCIWARGPSGLVGGGLWGGDCLRMLKPTPCDITRHMQFRCQSRCQSRVGSAAPGCGIISGLPSGL
jgi:hypothetical protein